MGSNSLWLQIFWGIGPKNELKILGGQVRKNDKMFFWLICFDLNSAQKIDISMIFLWPFGIWKNRRIWKKYLIVETRSTNHENWMLKTGKVLKSQSKSFNWAIIDFSITNLAFNFFQWDSFPSRFCLEYSHWKKLSSKNIFIRCKY